MNKKAEQIYSCIKKYMSENGYCPSVRELCSLCGIKSTATVYNYLNKLTDEGLIVKKDRKKRAICINMQYNTVPVIGTVHAGVPVFAEENYDGYLPVPTDIFGTGDVFALQVAGWSMKDVGICDKDYLLVNKQETASEGEIVVALIGDEATVKTLKKDKGVPYLHPENEAFDDIKPDSFSILGKAIGLIRRF